MKCTNSLISACAEWCHYLLIEPIIRFDNNGTTRIDNNKSNNNTQEGRRPSLLCEISIELSLSTSFCTSAPPLLWMGGRPLYQDDKPAVAAVRFASVRCCHWLVRLYTYGWIFAPPCSPCDSCEERHCVLPPLLPPPSLCATTQTAQYCPNADRTAAA